GEEWELTEPDHHIKNRHLCSKAELENRFTTYDQALRANEHIAEQCQVDIEMNKNRLPSFPLAEGEEAHTVLNQRCLKELHTFYAKVTEDIEERLTYELSIIKKLGFSDYFLIVADFV